MKMDIEERHLKIVKTILNSTPYTFYVFGSRAKGHAKKFSDLDLCFFDKIPNETLLHLEEIFENSDLPYKVDLVDFNACDKDFQKILLNDKIPF